MNRISLVSTAVFGLALLAMGSSSSAQVRMEHGGMELTMPGQPRADSIELESGERQYRLIFSQPTGTIIIWHQEANPAMEVQAALQKARDVIVEMSGGKVLSDRKASVDGHPARVFSTTFPAKDGEFRVGYYFADGKNYQVMALGTSDFTRSDDVDRMFNSIKFLK